MKEWLKISLMLCVFGFLKEIRPSEPYIVDFLTGPDRNFTREDINTEIIPSGCYSFAGMLILVFLLTDYFRYKPVIIIGVLSGTMMTAFFIWTETLEALRFVEFFLGLLMASEVAYLTYIYAKVDKEHYPKVTSHTRAALLCGKLVGGITGQLLIYFKVMVAKQLLYVTFSVQIAATLWACCLPSVKTSLYFHRKQEIKDESGAIEKNDSLQETNRISLAFKLIWAHFKSAYTNVKVIQWSIWYALGLCGYLQVLFNIQVMWNFLKNGNEVIWNGAVESTYTFFGALVSLLAGYLQSGRLSPRGSVLVTGISSMLQGLALLLVAWTQKLSMAYAGYIIFGVMYSFTVAIVSAQIARYLEKDSFGLVFGFNTFLGVLLEVLLSFIIIRPGGLNLDLKGQFTFFSFCFIIMGIFYAGSYIFEVFWDKRKRSHCCERF